MPMYSVEVPIVGTVNVTVDVDSEGEAINKALGTDVSENESVTWEMVREVTKGNVCSAPVNEATAELVDW